MGAPTSGPRSQRHSGVVVGVVLLLIGGIAVYAARGTQETGKPSAIVRHDTKSRPPVVDEQKRIEAAQVTTCTAIQKGVDASLTFDRAFTITPMSDGTSYLTTAALLNGRQVDVSAILQWDAQRQAWDVLEAYVGGAGVPIGQRAE
jgi:hypothetical protein